MASPLDKALPDPARPPVTAVTSGVPEGLPTLAEARRLEQLTGAKPHLWRRLQDCRLCRPETPGANLSWPFQPDTPNVCRMQRVCPPIRAYYYVAAGTGAMPLAPACTAGLPTSAARAFLALRAVFNASSSIGPGKRRHPRKVSSKACTK
jgi:hypothetical protein